MADKSWKAAERRIAKFLGTVRNALSGGNSKITRSDTHHHEIYLESKWASRSAVWSLWKDTKVKAKKENKLPVVCYFLKNHKGALLCMHIDDAVEVLQHIERARNEQRNEVGGKRKKRKRKKAY